MYHQYSDFISLTSFWIDGQTFLIILQEEAESNLRKAKQNYQTRNSEYQKAKEAKIKADQQHSDKTLGEGSHSRQVTFQLSNIPNSCYTNPNATEVFY